MNLIGRIINNYRFVSVLGSGQFGLVYKVIKDEEVFAAKIYYDHVFIKEYQREPNRIQREVEILKLANSHYLIKYYNDFTFYDEFEQRIYVVVMEYVEGLSLNDHLKNGEFTIDEKISLFKEILHGIDSLHNTTKDGIIHRDIKPENIIITPYNKVKILDYGLSKVIDFTSITQTGARIGSPIFMSPEQFKDSKNIDKRSDIYSLGVVLYYMLTNNYPYEANTIEELILKIGFCPITPPSNFNNDISNKLEKIIYKMLNKKLHLRYQTIKNVLFDIDNEETKLFSYRNQFYPWYINEKSVLLEHLKTSPNTKIIFPLHLKYSQKSIFKEIEEGNIKAIIDPSTHRFNYETYESVMGLKRLSYAPIEGIITLNDLQDVAYRNNFINRWIEEVKGFNEIILPYSYISNSNYHERELIKWLEIGIQLINDSVDKLNGNTKKYAMIAIDINHLVHKKDVILSYYSTLEVDGIFVQISGMKNLGLLHLDIYIRFLKELQLSTNVKVISLKVPVPIGLYALSNGIHGFSTGISAIESFEEDFFKIETEKFNLYARYYIKNFLSLVSYLRKEPYQLLDLIGTIIDECDCPYCQDKRFIEITSQKNYLIGLHFLYWMAKETDEINKIVDLKDKKDYYKIRIEKAISIFRELVDNDKLRKLDEYNLLQTINKHIR